MKEFNKTNTVTYNLMSFTGFKSLLLFALLLESPKTYPEICNYFKEHEYVKESMSLDTLRVYITSLKRVGCEIEKKKTTAGITYQIVSHPFEFKISEAQIKAIVKIYRILLKTATVKDILEFENFLITLSQKIASNELLDAIGKISIFKNLNKDIVKILIEHAKHNRRMTILYNSPKSSTKEISIVANDVMITQNKLYLCGVSLEYNQESSYPISRIKEIVSVDYNTDTTVELNYVTVGYELSTLNPRVKLADNEKIVEIKEDSVIVEARTTNMFMMKRKILEYGPLCTVLYPQEFREDIINTLQNMRKGYRNG